MSKSTILVALLAAVLLAFSARGGATEATYTPVNTIVGVDAITTGNTRTFVANIDRCVSVPVNPNAEFYVDLFVKDVTSLNTWQGTLRFEESILQVSSIDVGQVGQYFLENTPGSVVYNGSEIPPNSTGSFLAGATDQENLPESGSGVLARVGLKALAAGTSKLYFTLWWPFGISGVLLDDQLIPPNPIGDLNGDRYFDGLVFNAIVVVGSPCPLDADRDGFNNVEESIDGSDLLVAGSTPEMCDNVDNDLDTVIDEGYDRAPVNGIPDCVDPASNSDGDNPPIYNPTDTDDDNDSRGETQDPGVFAATCPAGPLPRWADCVEAYLATDSLAKCPLTLFYHSASPRDLNNDRTVTVPGDVLQYAGLIGTSNGADKFRKRLDLNGDGAITVPGDVLQFVSHIGEACS